LRESYRRIHHHIISLRDFVAHASHEFKTPLATLSALVDVLDSQSPHGSDTKLYHQRMKNTLTQMNNLLDALIALTHWEHTKPMITKVFLSSIVNDCL
jgi:signal transduction histidine kinase